MGSLEPFLSILMIANLRVFVKPDDEEFKASLVRSFISGQKCLNQLTVKPSGPGDEDPFICLKSALWSSSSLHFAHSCGFTESLRLSISFMGSMSFPSLRKSIISFVFVLRKACFAFIFWKVLFISSFISVWSLDRCEKTIFSWRGRKVSVDDFFVDFE